MALLYEVLSTLASPFRLELLCIVFVALWWWRRRSRGMARLGGVLLALLVLSSLPAVAFLAVRTLEWRYLASDAEATKSRQAIVVLGGGVRKEALDPRGYLLANDSLVRCIRAAEEYRRGGRPIVLVCGGRSQTNGELPPVAHVMRDFLVVLGVRAEDIVVEDRSTSTYENAVEAAKLLAARGLDRAVLVTEAIHMRRAELCFLRQGITVDPAPCRFRAATFDWSGYEFLPSSAATVNVDAVAHEWLGIVWYWWHGRI